MDGANTVSRREENEEMEPQILLEKYVPQELRLHQLSETLFEKFDAYLADLKAQSFEELSLKFQGIRSNFAHIAKLRDLDAIYYLHAINQLEEVDTYLSKAELNSLKANKKHIERSISAKSRDRYRLCVQLLEFANLLIGKYGLASADQYNYRLRGRGLLVQTLDLQEINKQIVSLESLWLAVTLETSPFAEIAHKSTIELSKMFYEYSIRLFNFFLQTEPEFSWKRPFRYSLMFLCKKWNVRQMVSDLHLAHLTFEKNLIEDILRLYAVRHETISI